MGCNADFGFSFGRKDYGLRKQTLAFGPQIGFCSSLDRGDASLEFGILYKQYLKRHGIFDYTDEESKMRFGMFVAIYF